MPAPLDPLESMVVMKTCRQLRESETWLLEEEMCWLLEMTEKEVQDSLGPEGGLALDATTRQDVGWVALGIFYWSAVGVTDERALARAMSVPRGMIRCARAWIQALRAEARDPETPEEPFAMYFVARCDDPGKTPTVVTWPIEHHLIDVDQIADQLLIPMKAVRRAINECVRTARRRRTPGG